jgi:diguanylate cyclase (GGDEF)-like protein
MTLEKTGAAPDDVCEMTSPGEAPDVPIDRLNQRAWSLKRSDPEGAWALAREACARSEQLGDLKGLAYGLLTLAFCAVDRLEFAQAQALLERAAQAAEAAGSPHAAARADFVQGFLDTRLGDFEAALVAHDRSRERFAALGDRLGETDALLFAAGAHIDRGAFAEARTLISECLKRYDALGDLEGRAQGLLMWAIVEAYYGSYTASLRANREALELKERLGDVMGQVSALNNLGSYYAASGADDRALEAYLEGLRRAERLSSASARLTLLANLAEALRELGDFERATRYALEVLQLTETLGRKREQVSALDTLAGIEMAAGNDARALAYAEQALALSEAIGEVETRVFILARLAQLLCRRGDKDASLARYAQGLELAQRTQNRAAETELRLNLGRSLAAHGELATAYAHLRRALELAQELKLRRAERETYATLSEVYERQGRLKEALEHYKRGHELEKELFGERAADKTRRLTAQFELEKLARDAEIERLRSVELAKSNAALERTLQEKAALLAQLREQAERLEQQTREDALTGLYNRRHLEEVLREAFAAARRYRHPLSVALIDLDRFKWVNDTLSHQVGDEVLRTAAEIFTRFTRAADVVARYGGEEFVLVMPQTDLQGARAVCERIREAVEQHPWWELHAELQVTVSIGLADDLSVQDHEKLLALADDNLYRAKREGKNRVV